MVPEADPAKARRDAVLLGRLPPAGPAAVLAAGTPAPWCRSPPADHRRRDGACFVLLRPFPNPLILRAARRQQLRSLGYAPYDVCLRRLGQSPVIALTSADPRLEVFPVCYVFLVLRCPLHLVHRSVDKSVSGSRMGVGDGERPDMIAVQEGGSTRAS